jgi:serine/threonine protein kinase
LFIKDYKSKEETQSKGMHHLSGIYTSEEMNATIDGKSMYCFSMTYPNKLRHYYCEDEREFKSWVDLIRKVTGYEDINSTYDILETLGKGRFGLVKICQNKISKRKAAIKILSKKCMSAKDIELFHTEIEILKICQHPNIIRLYDIFENQDFIYISIVLT